MQCFRHIALREKSYGIFTDSSLTGKNSGL